MKTNQLLKSAKIICTSSPFHGQIKDLLITDGIIKEISDSIDHADSSHSIISLPNLHVSLGWIDSKSNLREPGEEWKETIETGAKAGIAGGFSQLIISASTKQPLDSKNRIDFIHNVSNQLPISITPMGTLSHERKGEELSEMFEMSVAGAVAFSDDKQDVSTGLMSKALLYSKNINKLIVSFPNDNSLSSSGQIHEGKTSTRMGLKGIPSLSETLRIERDLALADYHDSPIHFSCISSEKSVNLIRAAKEKGLKVTCDIAAHQLFFTDKNANEFDSHFKVLPPFREQKDIDALIQGLKDGTIDAICSDHTPHDIEDKKLEFDLAEFGIIGLETAFACAHSILKGKLNTAEIIEKFTTGPSKIFGLEQGEIKEGTKANLTLFDPSLEWVFDKSNIKSKSKNTPFIGEKFTGKSLGVIC